MPLHLSRLCFFYLNVYVLKRTADTNVNTCVTWQDLNNNPVTIETSMPHLYPVMCKPLSIDGLGNVTMVLECILKIFIYITSVLRFHPVKFVELMKEFNLNLGVSHVTWKHWDFPRKILLFLVTSVLKNLARVKLYFEVFHGWCLGFTIINVNTLMQIPEQNIHSLEAHRPVM